MRRSSVRRARRALESRLRPRRGVSLVEVMVAVSLLTIGLLALARVAPLVTRQGRANDVRMQRAYVVQQQADRLMALPYDSLVRITSGTTRFKVGKYSFDRTLAMLDSMGMKKVTLTIKPIPPAGTRDTMPYRAERLVVWRAIAKNSPLCTGCP